MSTRTKSVNVPPVSTPIQYGLKIVLLPVARPLLLDVPHGLAPALDEVLPFGHGLGTSAVHVERGRRLEPRQAPYFGEVLRILICRAGIHDLGKFRMGIGAGGHFDKKPSGIWMGRACQQIGQEKRWEKVRRYELSSG